MKLAIVGASHFANRMFEACGNYQWARELLKNSVEAHATKVEFGIEWQAVEKEGVYRRVIADDGIGMARDELLEFFSTLGEGAKRIGGVHDNFGVGAKIASLPWNPEGVVVISCKDGSASMIQIQLDAEAAEYELRKFQDEKGLCCAIDPTQVEWAADEVNWAAVIPDFAREHGTTIVLLGSKGAPHTVLGNPVTGEKDIKGVSMYLNSRFWDLSKLDVTVVELRSDNRSSWPVGKDDRDDGSRPNNRRIRGAKYYLGDVSATAGKLLASSSIPIDEGRVQANWYLWEGDRPNIHSYARKPGYIAVKYKGELFELTSSKAHFRWFGIADSKIQQNLSIILEPNLLEPQISDWGVHPDQSRNRLIFTGNGDKGVGLPLACWGSDFAEKMPQEIRDAISKARADGDASLQDEEYRRRLQNRFGNRWLTTQLVQAREGETGPRPATPDNDTAEVIERQQSQNRTRTKKRRERPVKIIRLRAIEGGSGSGVERPVGVDVPRFRYVGKDQFWHLASWVPNDPEGPTVLMNRDAPQLIEAIKHHQDHYPEVFVLDVEKIVKDAFGEIAVCKIAHSQQLVAQVTAEDLDATYRSEAALTLALMGLLAEESVIGPRLSTLGRKKMAA
jgi:hypothetical protein